MKARITMRLRAVLVAFMFAAPSGTAALSDDLPATISGSSSLPDWLPAFATRKVEDTDSRPSPTPLPPANSARQTKNNSDTLHEVEQRAKATPPVQDCDRLASHPDDPDKVTDGVPDIMNPKEAIEACRSAISAYPDIARFKFQLGRALEQEGSKQEAFRQFRAAAEAGHSDAMESLAMMLWTGDGVAKDEKQAVKWFLKAAELNNVLAMVSLGYVDRPDLGVPLDEIQAKDWHRRAFELTNNYASRGDAQHMFNLGFMYENGLGVAKDFVSAAYWYKQAAEKGNAYAMNALSSMYLAGRGVAQDSIVAVQWLRKAAEQGHLHSMDQLGGMYAEGTYFVAKDLDEAVKWYRKAAAAGYESAREALRKLGYEVDDDVTNHHSEGNGLSVEHLDELPDLDKLD